MGNKGNIESSSDLAKRAIRAQQSRRGAPRRSTGDNLRITIQRAIEEYHHEHGRPPTIREIATAVGKGSTGHVAHHVKILVEQGVLTREAGKSRGLMLTRRAGLRVLGTIAAGEPLGIYDDGESEWLELDELAMAMTSVPATTGTEVYALRVRGTSMIEDGVLDGDFAIIAPGSTFVDGETVVAIENTGNGDRGAATLKHIFRRPDGIDLQPANPAFDVRFIPAREWDTDWSVQGTVLAIYRRYKEAPPTRRDD